MIRRVPAKDLRSLGSSTLGDRSLSIRLACGAEPQFSLVLANVLTRRGQRTHRTVWLEAFPRVERDRWRIVVRDVQKHTSYAFGTRMLDNGVDQYSSYALVSRFRCHPH